MWEELKKMRCPYCGSLDDKVIESRTMANGESIRRRRECLSCGYRFTSYERTEEKPFMVVKRDKRRQPFDHTKLAKGIADDSDGSLNTLFQLVGGGNYTAVLHGLDGSLLTDIYLDSRLGRSL